MCGITLQASSNSVILNGKNHDPQTQGPKGGFKAQRRSL